MSYNVKRDVVLEKSLQLFLTIISKNLSLDGNDKIVKKNIEAVNMAPNRMRKSTYYMY